MVDQQNPFSYNIRQAFLGCSAEHEQKSAEEMENIPTEISVSQ